AGLSSLAGTTSAVTPAPSRSTLYAPCRVLVRQATVTSAVVPRCTATGVTWVSIGNEVWAAAAAGTRTSVSAASAGRMRDSGRGPGRPRAPPNRSLPFRVLLQLQDRLGALDDVDQLDDALVLGEPELDGGLGPGDVQVGALDVDGVELAGRHLDLLLVVLHLELALDRLGADL